MNKETVVFSDGITYTVRIGKNSFKQIKIKTKEVIKEWLSFTPNDKFDRYNKSQADFNKSWLKRLGGRPQQKVAFATKDEVMNPVFDNKIATILKNDILKNSDKAFKKSVRKHKIKRTDISITINQSAFLKIIKDALTLLKQEENMGRI